MVRVNLNFLFESDWPRGDLPFHCLTCTGCLQDNFCSSIIRIIEPMGLALRALVSSLA